MHQASRFELCRRRSHAKRGMPSTDMSTLVLNPHPLFGRLDPVLDAKTARFIPSNSCQRRVCA